MSDDHAVRQSVGQPEAESPDCAVCGAPDQRPGLPCWVCQPAPQLPAVRDALGRFGKANGAAVTHGAYSRLLASDRAEARAGILTARGFDSTTVDPVYDVLLSRFLEASAIAGAYFSFIEQHGAVSAKGNTRAAVAGWARATSRVERLAAMLGLERKARRIVQSPAEWLAGTVTEAPAEAPAVPVDGGPPDREG